MKRSICVLNLRKIWVDWVRQLTWNNPLSKPACLPPKWLIGYSAWPHATTQEQRSTLRHPVAFEDSRAKIIGLHVALCARNLGAESGRELFKGSKDTASLLVCTEKRNFFLGVANFL